MQKDKHFLLYRLATCPSSAANWSECLTVETDNEDGVSDNLNIDIALRSFTENSNSYIKTNQMEDGSNIPDSPVPHDITINADNRGTSQDENTKNSVPSSASKKKKQGRLNGNALCSKVLVIFGVCCITGCFLIPVIFYYVNKAQNIGEIDPEFSNEKNTSAAKVCCKLIV